MNRKFLPAISGFLFFFFTTCLTPSASWAQRTSSGSPMGGGMSYNVWDGSYGDWSSIYRRGAPTEEDCRICHEDLKRFPLLQLRNPDKHHVLIGQPIPRASVSPNPTPSGIYECLSCHSVQQIGDVFQVMTIRDCLRCHPVRTVTGSPRSANVHHGSEILRKYSCGACHTGWRQTSGSWGR